MPKTTGTPITITAGQPQREVTHFNVSVTYVAGVPSFQFNAFGTVRLRATNDSIIFQEEQRQLASFTDSQLHNQVKTALETIISRIDTI